MGVLATHGAAARRKSPPPLWEVNLSRLSPLDVPDARAARREFELWRFQQGLVFTQPGTLAAYFVVDEGNTNLSTRDRPSPTDPYHLRAVFLDAEHGSVVRVGDWPTRPDGYSSLFAARDGKFIVFAAGALSLYSPNMSLLAQYVPAWLDKAVFGTFIVLPSPAGDTLLATRCEGSPGRCTLRAALLNTGNLSTDDSPSLNADDHPKAVWGERVAWTSNDQGPHVGYQTVYVSQPGARPRMLMRGWGSFGTYLSFLNESTLALSSGFMGQSGSLVLLSTNGAVLSTLDLGRKVIRKIVASQGGRFFAVEFFVPGWFDSPIPRGVSIRVFGLTGERPVLSVDVPERFVSAVALSPDGRLLAVKVGAVVRVYRVPRPSDGGAAGQ